MLGCKKKRTKKNFLRHQQELVACYQAVVETESTNNPLLRLLCNSPFLSTINCLQIFLYPAYISREIAIQNNWNCILYFKTLKLLEKAKVLAY